MTYICPAIQLNEQAPLSRSMTPPPAQARDLPKPQVSAQKGALLRTLLALWPYIWPSDRADLKMRVLLGDGAAADRQARDHHGALHLQMGDRCAGRPAERAGLCVFHARPGWWRRRSP